MSLRPPPATAEQAKCARRINADLSKATTEEEFAAIREDIRESYRNQRLTRRQTVAIVDKYNYRGRHILGLPIERV